ncbi:transcriptional regulator CynR [Rhodococcus triatomae]|uniref:LysR family transcriptional regulator, cyn operon transcriptional activator n=1 Tax=Rhodococcus triatomae TaxID=300028 RepID=A0A1G8H1F6_9NOCA|nr:transcriptional regulator CynR [Rhodococcus triatomae]QNG20236.1 transcriptional regulator CynR [Rhodococcus triatomae]QNG23849.1 transcriptional regulator CynR [Rhodococcus triatomae]SDI00436.1 LysR family transcriptional regulator, cyn operon transcriptional activator [Rhodococcus triatomae]
MELRHVRYLLAVADHGSFSRAAEALQVSQPTLSQQIKQLETGLGVQLLDRSGRSVRLTDAGEAYARHSRLALRELEAGERAVHDVQDLSRGQVRLSVIPTITAYLTGPLLHRFHRSYPGITLSVTEASQSRIEAALLTDTVDLGIGFGESRTAGIRSSPLFIERLGLVASSVSPLARRQSPLPIGDLARVPLALLTPNFATRMRIDDYFSEQDITPNVVLEADSIGALLEVVRRGAMATILPGAIADGHADYLAPISLEPELPTRGIELLTRTTAYRSAAARAFDDVVSKVVVDLRL